MSTITIEIKAPELAEVLNNLASALAIGKNSQNPALNQVQTPIAPIMPLQTTPSTPTTQATPITNQAIPTAPIGAPAPITPAIPTTPAQPQTTTVPTTEQTYTMEQLAVAATQLMDAGKRNDLVNLLSSFRVQSLTALPKEQYGAFATQLRAMGAKI